MKAFSLNIARQCQESTDETKELNTNPRNEMSTPVIYFILSLALQLISTTSLNVSKQ